MPPPLPQLNRCHKVDNRPTLACVVNLWAAAGGRLCDRPLLLLCQEEEGECARVTQKSM